MKTIAFKLSNLSFRGTTTAIKDYAYYNERLLGNKSIIMYDKKILYETLDENFLKKEEVVNSFKELFDVVEYDNLEELDKELTSRNCEYVYSIKAGFNDSTCIANRKNLVHAVFNYYQPHGHRYAYVSKWLSDVASNGLCPYVPHMVDLPKNYSSSSSYRNRLNLGEGDKYIVGRYGGFEQFDIPMVQNFVKYIAFNDPNVVFLFVNTHKFVDLPNVIFLDSIVSPSDKTAFINSCDVMLHARSDGESFGLSIAEFLSFNIPVLSFGGGRDKNNIELLKSAGIEDLIYNTEYELFDAFFKVRYQTHFVRNYYDFLDTISADTVMEQFDMVFLH